MEKINWDKFKVINEDYRKSFEELSYYLFCRKHKIKLGVFQYKNQIGIEVEPIKKGRSRIGFQAKWFDFAIDKNKITDSIERAKSKNPKLNKIVFYIYCSFSESTKKGKKDDQKKTDIESFASSKKIKIEWIVPSKLQILLTQPSNLDLAQLYFGLSDEFGFIKTFSNPDILTFLQSSEYINLPLVSIPDDKTVDIKKQILDGKKKSILLTGHPGAGKSIFIHNVFQVLSGLDKANLSECRKVLQKNKAIPMVINLKNCAVDSLENIIRERQNDFKLRNKQLGYIYLLDGLDELSSERAEHVLTYLFELDKHTNTIKIIISCRTGNYNRVKARTYFKNIVEFRIKDLSEKDIQKYFQGKSSREKINLLTKLSLKNQDLLKEVKDILLVKLLWDTIENLNSESTIIDLLNKKVELLVNEPQYKKNIDELNLLNPKEEKIIALNKELSFKFQNKFQFRLSQSEIQKVILSIFPRIDYKSTNEILDYLSTLFFDASPPLPGSNGDGTYIYQHRRYQDFFFIQYVSDAYEKDPTVLRKLSILSNRDFFEELLLPYLREKYKSQNNLPGILETNLIDVYLGNRNDFGADDPYYQNSAEFIPSIASQNGAVIEGLLSDEKLGIKNKISIDIDDVKNKFAEWDKDQKNWRLINYLTGVWNSGLSFLIVNITTLIEFNKNEQAEELRRVAIEIHELFEKYKFKDRIEDREKEQLHDPYWSRWEDYLYLKLTQKEKPEKLLKERIRANYKYFQDENVYVGVQEDGKNKLIKSLYRAIIRFKPTILLKIINQLDDEEISKLLDVLVSKENLPFLIKRKAISLVVTAKIKNLSRDNINLIFLKKLFGLSITKNEIDFVNERRKEIREKRGVDWRIYDTQDEYSKVSYIIEEASFEDYLKEKEDSSFRYYNELGLYAALFKKYVELLKDETKIESVVRDYIRYVEFYYERAGGFYLKYDISSLWAHIFIESNGELEKLRYLKNRLFSEDYNIVPLAFYTGLWKKENNLFIKLISRTELQTFEQFLDNWDDDFPSYVNHCFQMAIFYSKIDEQKSLDYISKGINEGMVRHGWHKDTIVCYMLTESLEILWRNSWLPVDELKKLSDEVYKLTKKAKQVTDGKYTSQGPYTLLDIVSKYNLDYAVKLKEDIDITYEHSRYTSNITLSSIIKSKISMGYSFEEIEEEIKKYHQEYRYDGKTDPSYYEYKFEDYLLISQNESYTETEREKAFELAYQQIENIKKEGIDYYLADWKHKDIKKKFIRLCKKYNKKVNINLKKEKEYKSSYNFTESNFIKEIKKTKTKRNMRELLKNLNDQAKLEKQASWKIVVNKTYEIFGDISPFVSLLRENSYPHKDWFRTNSQYFHLGVAVALDDINMKSEMLAYLFDKTTGHGGFVNLMKSYEIIGNRDMCIFLFKRFLRICKFLVY